MNANATPQISICLPVYNGEQYLADAINSALTQTFSDFELLISDDCSTDSSSAIIATLAAKDSRIRHWKNEKNLGLFANYNAAMRQARGKFIKPYAQDDFWEPTILACELEALTANPTVALVACARRIVDENGQEIKVLAEYPNNTVLTYDEVLKDNLIGLKNTIGEPSTVMFPREHLGEGFDCGYYHLGDIEYWFRVIGKNKFLYLDEPLCRFRTHSKSTTSKNEKGLRFALDMLKMGSKYRTFLDDIGVSEETYSRLVAEATATHVKYLSRRGMLSLQDLLSVKSATPEAMQEDLAGFKEILFYTLLMAGETLEENYSLKREWEFERNNLEDKIAMLMKSKSWRLTIPLRRAMKILRK
ncbi:MAG TPA: glycosyltransferase [Oculatellaceae cyanobacterium]